MFSSISTFDFFFLSMIVIAGVPGLGMLIWSFIKDTRKAQKAGVMAVRNK